MKIYLIFQIIFQKKLKANKNKIMIFNNKNKISKVMYRMTYFKIILKDNNKTNKIIKKTNKITKMIRISNKMNKINNIAKWISNQDIIKIVIYNKYNKSLLDNINNKLNNKMRKL